VKALLTLISGWKTHIVGAALVLTGIGMILDGDVEAGVQSILAGLGLSAVRSAVKKAEVPK